MTREELARALSAIARTLEQRVEVWRVIIDEHGNELHRLFRCSFQRPRDSHTASRIVSVKQGETE